MGGSEVPARPAPAGRQVGLYPLHTRRCGHSQSQATDTHCLLVDVGMM